MDTKHLQCFLTVARLLNFSEAAKFLNYSQSTVSDQVRSLEEQLGVKLFERVGKRVYVSSQGNRLLQLAERMVRTAEEIEGVFAQDGIVSGSLTIGAAESLCAFWLPPVLKQYRSLYPNVRVLIKVGSCPEFKHWLQQNLIDVSFGLSNESEQPQFRQIELFRGKTLLVAAPESELSKLAIVHPKDLENQILILSEEECGYHRDFEKQLSKENVAPGPQMEFGSLEAIKQCVKNGLGVSLLPQIAVKDEIERGELVVLPWTGTPIPFEARMLFHREKWLSPALSALEEVIHSVPMPPDLINCLQCKNFFQHKTGI